MPTISSVITIWSIFIQLAFSSCIILIASFVNILTTELLSVMATNLLLAFAPNGTYFNMLETLDLYPAIVYY